MGEALIIICTLLLVVGNVWDAAVDYFHTPTNHPGPDFTEKYDQDELDIPTYIRDQKDKK